MEFASCASKFAALQAVCCVVGGMVALMLRASWIVLLVFGVIAVGGFVLAYRSRGRPYVAVRDGWRTTYNGSRLLQQVDLHRLVGFRPSWNKTTLQSSDGSAVVIDHSLFSSSAEVARFRTFVEQISGGENGITRRFTA